MSSSLFALLCPCNPGLIALANPDLGNEELKEEPNEPKEVREFILFIAFWTPDDMPEKEVPMEPVLLLRVSMVPNNCGARQPQRKCLAPGVAWLAYESKS